LAANDIKQRIGQLEDEDALRAAAQMSAILKDDLSKDPILKEDLAKEGAFPDVLEVDIDDEQAAKALAEAFPQLGDVVARVRPAAPLPERAEAARTLLAFLADDPSYRGKVESALDSLQTVVDPLTGMAVGALILFVLTTEFKVERKVVNGRSVLTWSVKRDRSKIEELKLIFNPVDAVKRIFGLGRTPKTPAAGTE
jgi:hypothetical protein